MGCNLEQSKITLYSLTGCIGLHIVLSRPTFFILAYPLPTAVAAFEAV
jgi:hypothetical protein